MIPAQRERNFAGLERFHYKLGMLGASGRDLLQIFGVRVALFLLLRNGDGDIAAVFHFVPERLQSRLESGRTLPNLRRSRYHLKASSGQLCLRMRCSSNPYEAMPCHPPMISP